MDHNGPTPPNGGRPALERVKRLSDAVRRSAEVHRDTVSARNAAMLEAHDAGTTIGELAKASGLRRQTVMEAVYAEVAERGPLTTTSSPPGAP